MSELKNFILKSHSKKLEASSFNNINVVKKTLRVYLFDRETRNVFLNSIQNSHVHEPSKLIENLQHLHITTEKNLTSDHCLKLKSLGFIPLKSIVLTFC